MIRSRLIALSFSLAFVPAVALPPVASAQLPAKGGQKQHADGTCKCPVTGTMLPKGKGVPVKVKEHTYRVVDDVAAKELEAHPDQFLSEDGTPKNQ